MGEHGIDQGVEQPISLVWIDESKGAVSQVPRQPNIGHFIFDDRSVLLDQKFETVWETR